MKNERRIRRSVLLGALVALWIPLHDEAQGGAVYTLDARGLEVEAPSGWLPIESLGRARLTLREPVDGRITEESVGTLSVHVYDATVGLDAWIEHHRRQLVEEIHPGSAIVEDRWLDDHDPPARYMEVSDVDGQLDLLAVLLRTESPSFVYLSPRGRPLRGGVPRRARIRSALDPRERPLRPPRARADPHRSCSCAGTPRPESTGTGTTRPRSKKRGCGTRRSFS